MRLSRILETEDIKRSIIIRDRNNNEIRVRGVDEALTLPAELLGRRVVCYECSDNEAFPIRITVAESMEGIRKYKTAPHNPKKEWRKDYGKNR